MAALDRRPARRLVLAAAMTVAGALTLAAAPAGAAPGKAPARTAKARPAPAPLDGPTCLFPIPGQECSEEERRLCDAPTAPDPVVVDCRDPANAWVLEMVGECDMPRLSGAAAPGPERERPHDQSCLDTESCGAVPAAAAPLGPAFDHQPAIDRASLAELVPALRLPVPPELVRRHPGYPRAIEHPPRP